MINIDNDVTTIEDGVWVDFEGSEFRIAHISNRQFQRELARLQQPHRRRIDAGTADPDLLRDIMCKAMSNGLVRDWKTVVDSTGAEVKYEASLAYKALKNNPQLRDFVTDFATNLDNYHAEVVSELGKG